MRRLGAHWPLVLLACVSCSFDASGIATGAGSDGGPGNDGQAGPDAGLPPIPTCGRPAAHRDDFEDGVRNDAVWWVSGSGVTETGGALQVDPAADATDWQAYLGRYYADMREGGYVLEIDQMLSTSADIEAFFVLQRDNDWSVAMAQRNGQLYGAITLDRQAEYFPAIPFDSTAHRFWQIREASGTVYYETSPDGTSWTTRWMRPGAAFLTTVRPQVGVWEPTPPSGAGVLRIASINGQDSTTSAWCPTSSMSDEFAGGAFGLPWFTNSASSSACQVTESGGAAEVSHTGQSGERCDFVSAAAFDLRDSQVVFQIEPLAATPADTVFFARAISFDWRLAEVYVRGNQLCGRVRWFDSIVVEETCSTFDASQVYWRIKQTGNTIEMASSADNSSWTTLHSYNGTFNSDVVDLAFGSYTINTSPASTVRLTAINP